MFPFLRGLPPLFMEDWGVRVPYMSVQLTEKERKKKIKTIFFSFMRMRALLWPEYVSPAITGSVWKHFSSNLFRRLILSSGKWKIMHHEKKLKLGSFYKRFYCSHKSLSVTESMNLYVNFLLNWTQQKTITSVLFSFPFLCF